MSLIGLYIPWDISWESTSLNIAFSCEPSITAWTEEISVIIFVETGDSKFQQNKSEYVVIVLRISIFGNKFYHFLISFQ